MHKSGDDDDYAKEKLKFISNLNGTNLSDLTLYFTTVPLVILLNFIIKLFFIYKFNFDLKYKNFSNIKWLTFTLDFVLCCVPLVFITTVLCNYLTQVQFAYAIVILILYKILFYNTKPATATVSGTTTQNESQLSVDDAYAYREQILDFTFKLFRVSIYIITAVCILAVDFKVFSRRYAKTETYGVSLMDIGVGVFVAAHALKATKREYKTKPNEVVDPMQDLKELTGKFQSTIKSSSILIILGLARLISVTMSGYVVKVTEYGVHWNFFFTLAIVKIFSCPFHIYTRNSPLRAFMLAFIFGTAYQHLLTNNGYSNYILYEPINTNSVFYLIHANKEGLYSCFGYFSIYFAAQSVSIYLSLKAKENTANLYTPFLKAVLYLLFITNLYFTALQLSRFYVEDVSRRLCNISFVCFTMMFLTLMLALYLCTILFVSVQCTRLSKLKKREVHKTEDLRIKNFIFSMLTILDSKFVGLFLFMLANVLTGLINLSVNTLKVSSPIALAILLLYIFTITFLSYCVYELNLNRIKMD